MTDLERVNLRRYLVEGQGLLVFDDCVLGEPDQALIRIVQAELRAVLPEYALLPVRNDHPLYSAYYELSGPPVGFDVFWYHPPQKRNFLEGISIGDKLVALTVRRDYMCSMETLSYPSRSASPSPAVYRWATNAVVYSLTTGNIADYKNYVPEATLADHGVPLVAPPSARVDYTPVSTADGSHTR